MTDSARPGLSEDDIELVEDLRNAAASLPAATSALRTLLRNAASTIERKSHDAHHASERISEIADLGSCARARTPAYKLFQEAIDLATRGRPKWEGRA
jgi:hypothetical protein